jgi:hypothetical protein
MHKTEIEGIFIDPRAPKGGAVGEMGDDTHLEITVIADNPLSSCNYKLNYNPAAMVSIAKERSRLENHAKEVGYSGIAQIADYQSGECVTFRL